jgi:hypothetical protein
VSVVETAAAALWDGAALGASLAGGALAAADWLGLLPPDEQAPTSSASIAAPRAAVRMCRMGPP